MTFHVLDARHRTLATRDDHIAARHYFRDARMAGADAALIVDDDGIIYGGAKLPNGHASHMPLTVPMLVTVAASVHALAMEHARRQERGIGHVLVPALAAARVPASEPSGPRKRVTVQVPVALRNKIDRLAGERGVTAERVATDAVHAWGEMEARW